MREIYESASGEVGTARNIVGVGSSVIGSVPLFIAKLGLKVLGRSAAVKMSKSLRGNLYVSGTNILGGGVATASQLSGVAIVGLENLLMTNLRKRRPGRSGRLSQKDIAKRQEVRAFINSIKEKANLSVIEYLDQINGLRSLVKKQYVDKIDNMPTGNVAEFLNIITLGGKLLTDLKVRVDYYSTMKGLHQIELENLKKMKAALRTCSEHY